MSGRLTEKQRARVDRIVRDACKDWSLPPDPEEGASFAVIVREAIELALLEEQQDRAATPSPSSDLEAHLRGVRDGMERAMAAVSGLRANTAISSPRYDAFNSAIKAIESLKESA